MEAKEDKNNEIKRLEKNADEKLSDPDIKSSKEKIGTLNNT